MAWADQVEWAVNAATAAFYEQVAKSFLGPIGEDMVKPLGDVMGGFRL